jgi:hypothetical protein
MVDSESACLARAREPSWARTQGEAHAGGHGQARGRRSSEGSQRPRGCGELGINRLAPSGSPARARPPRRIASHPPAPRARYRARLRASRGCFASGSPGEHLPGAVGADVGRPVRGDNLRPASSHPANSSRCSSAFAVCGRLARAQTGEKPAVAGFRANGPGWIRTTDRRVMSPLL